MIYIFTPTFNRKYNLLNLYASLVKQTDKNFVWLIIDDGSTDGTDSLIKDFIKDNLIKIKYELKENGGKHTAYNWALDIMNGEGFHICVDSDDYLCDNAVEIIRKDLLNLDKNFVGIVYPKINIDKRLSSKIWLPQNIDRINIQDFQYKYNLSIETLTVIKNINLKDFRFPVYKFENFMPEGILYIHLSKQGYFKPMYKELYYFKYQDDGLTRNIFNLWKLNIEGTLHNLNSLLHYVSCNFKGIKKIFPYIKLKLNIQSLLLTKYSLIHVLSNEKFSWKFLVPFSYLFKKYRFR